MIKYWIRSCVDNLLKTDPSVKGCLLKNIRTKKVNYNLVFVYNLYIYIYIYIYIYYSFLTYLKKIEKVEKIDRMKKLTRKRSFFF